MASVNPYLNFDGTCEAAFNFYHSVFGGEAPNMMRFKDMPMEGKPAPDNIANQIMHVSLTIGNTFLMGSDAPGGFATPLSVGNNFAVSIDTSGEAEADKLFNGLSAGGQVTMPIGKSPWNSYFGMFTDKFGINWMVSYNYDM